MVVMVTTDILEEYMRHILASSIMLSSLLLPAAANAKQPSEDATAPTPTRVSTGVTAPTLLSSIGLTLPEGLPKESIPVDAQIGLTLTVDAKGQPQDVHVVKGISPFWDARVVDAVRQFQYHPGTVDAMPIPVDMNLTVTIGR
jgi:murein L,D-transpeptidase YcbB/YkuD